jgi:AraC-like DNA-binding protein
MDTFLLTIKTYNLDVEIHKHSAYQIVLSQDNPFTSTIGGTIEENIFGFLIKPHVSHLCKADKSVLNIINIEPYSTIGFELNQYFANNTDTIIFKTHNDINKQFQIDKTSFDISDIITSLINNQTNTFADDRVNKIIAYIQKNFFQQNITPQTFADFVFLSPSRLASLFKQQTGSSLSKYLLWTRLREAIYLSLADKNRTITDIAYDTGFYDLPQLNKYMYEMFGVPPKALKQNSDLIQVL